jgi:hypothetical protein
LCYNFAVINFDNFEALAEHLIEGSFGRIFRIPLSSGDLARLLARSMEDEQRARPDGQALFPNRYWIHLNPSDYDDFGDELQQMREELALFVHRIAEESGGWIDGPAVVTLHATDSVSGGQIVVRAGYAGNADPPVETREFEVLSTSEEDPKFWALKSQSRTFRLGEPVIRLGRALSNDVILDDPQVSRRHAQLRWRSGSYHVSDVGSTYGVKVNGQPLEQGQEFRVESGDRIALAGVELVVFRYTPDTNPMAENPSDCFSPSSPEQQDTETIT